MRKPTGHKEKYPIKSEISQSRSNDGTSARTRPFSFDEIMLRRKNKKQSASVEHPRVVSEVVSGKGDEGRVESDRRRHRHGHRDIVGGGEKHRSKDSSRASSGAKEHKSVRREDKIVEYEYKESNNANIRSKIGSNSAQDRKKVRGVHSDDSDKEFRKRHGKESAVEDRDRNVDRNREKSEHVSKRTQNGYDERGRDHQDSGKKHESRKLHDLNTLERQQNKGTSESRNEDLKSRRKRSRSRDHDRDKSRRSRSPSPRGHKQRPYDMRDHEDINKDIDRDKSRRSRSPSPRGHKQRPYDMRDHEDINKDHDRDKSRRSRSPSPRGHKQRPYDMRDHEELSSHSSKDKKKILNNGSSKKSNKRDDTYASRLGGYSPRKRRSEAAVKTPSPTSRSPEKKKTWDSPPAKMEEKFSSNKTETINRHEVSSVVPLTPSTPKPTFGVLSGIPLMMNVSVDSVQLTEATRPKRRIYVENLPSSASEAAVMQWLSGYLRPSGVNHVKGTSPCISCILNKEKGQALVEFLTPEDATTTLSFDGKSFSGNVVRIRRPKDYVETTTGVSEKPVAEAVSVRNIVEDSPNKIFVGGISKVITSEMLMEIATAFGPLKAYHFEDNANVDSPCAFVEYADQSLTVKACVGLNGMKLGGQVLTVTQATLDVSLLENHGDQPFYGTPVHVQPLLEKPTRVLKLSNMLDPHSLPALSESELEEILEDIRLECARFGMVKSINIMKQIKMPTNSETVKITEEANTMVDEVTKPSCSDAEQHEEVEDPADGNDCHNEPEKVNGVAGAAGIVDNKHENKMAKDETCDTTMVDSVVENQNLEKANQTSSSINQSESNCKPTDNIETENNIESRDAMKTDSSDLNDNFELGCILVEYKRIEASSMAAHCLHGRVFDGRSVSVEYVAHDVYYKRFHK